MGHITVRLPDDLSDAVIASAAASNISKSDWVRDVIAKNLMEENHNINIVDVLQDIHQVLESMSQSNTIVYQLAEAISRIENDRIKKLHLNTVYTRMALDSLLSGSPAVKEAVDRKYNEWVEKLKTEEAATAAGGVENGKK